MSPIPTRTVPHQSADGPPTRGRLNPLARYVRTPKEGIEFNAARDTGRALLVWFDSVGQRIIELEPGVRDIGREDLIDRATAPPQGDRTVSRAHARLELIGGNWTIENRSKNKTRVNGSVVTERRRLKDGDLISIGPFVLGAVIADSQTDTTLSVDDGPAEQQAPAPQITEAQRNVLVELCRPHFDHNDPLPASQNDMRQALRLSGSAVKKHCKALYAHFEINGTTNNKAPRLMHLVIEQGVIAQVDYPKGSE